MSAAKPTKYIFSRLNNALKTFASYNLLKTMRAGLVLGKGLLLHQLVIY